MLLESALRNCDEFQVQLKVGAHPAQHEPTLSARSPSPTCCSNIRNRYWTGRLGSGVRRTRANLGWPLSRSTTRHLSPAYGRMTCAGRRGYRRLAKDMPAGHRVSLQASPCSSTRLHGRAVCRGPGSHARRHGGAGRRPRAHQPAGKCPPQYKVLVVKHGIHLAVFSRAREQAKTHWKSWPSDLRFSKLPIASLFTCSSLFTRD